MALASLRRKNSEKKEYMEKQTALAWASDLAKKMTAKPSEKAPEGKRVWTCQILCIHNFFLCTLFCAHQFDWMLYLVIGIRKTEKRERSHFVFAHMVDGSYCFRLMFYSCCCYSWHDKIPFQCFSEHIYLNLILLRLPLFLPHSILNQQKLSRELYIFMCKCKFPSFTLCLPDTLFIYLCRLMLMISGWICCKLPKNSGNNNDKKICPHKRESVSLSNRIPMDKEESVWRNGIKFLHQFLRVHVWKWQPQPFLPSNHSKCAFETRKTLHIVVR